MLHHQNFLAPHHQQQQHQHHEAVALETKEQHPLHQLESSSSPSSSNNSSLLSSSPSRLTPRVSPASTALVMSSNNLNSAGSRQLTPSSSPSNHRGGTHSSGHSSRSLTNHTNSNSQNQLNHNHQQQQDQQSGASNRRDQQSQQQNQQQQQQQQPIPTRQPPNPSARQFVNCHNKSQSAGIVVPVPGISSNNLGPHRNVIVPNSHHPPNPHRPLPLDPDSPHHSLGQHHHNHHHHQVASKNNNNCDKQQVAPPMAHSRSQHQYTRSAGSNSLNQQATNTASNNNNNNNNNNNYLQQQVIREHPTLTRNQHSNSHDQQLFHQASSNQQHQHQHHNRNHHESSASNNYLNKSSNRLDAGQAATNQTAYILQNQNNQAVQQQQQQQQQQQHHHHHQNQNHHHHHHHITHHHRSASAQLTHHLNGNQTNHSQNNINNNVMLHNNHNAPHGNNHHQVKELASNYQPTDSLWSMNDNILSKSQAKLTGSGFMQHSALFRASNTDMSCDNISTASRFLDAGPPPPPPANSYFLQHYHSATGPGGPLAGALKLNNKTNGPLRGTLSASGQSIKRPEFLPFCDLMFNFISMIIYFCENVFVIIALIALYYHSNNTGLALLGSLFMLGSNFVCQYFSFMWHYQDKMDECDRKCEAQEAAQLDLDSPGNADQTEPSQQHQQQQQQQKCDTQQQQQQTGNRFYSTPAALTGTNSNSHLNQYQPYNAAAGAGGTSHSSTNWLPYNGKTDLQVKFLIDIFLNGLAHLLLLGFLLRYIKLVIPITDTNRVKRNARDLCMLRMIHAFTQSMPLLLMQSYIICSQASTMTISNLNIISALLSLINVCWALASFTKYSRKKYLHKFVLTWLGIMSQLLWRLGTISSRVVSLTVYSVCFGCWVLVIISLHWIAMLVWLLKPGNFLKDETNMSATRRVLSAMAVAWIHCFCYVNLEEMNSKLKIFSYYTIMFLENNLLLTVSLIISYNSQVWFRNSTILIIYLGFFIGIMFMLIYYKYLHASVLNSKLSCSRESLDSIADQLTTAGKKIAGFKPGTLRLKGDDNFAFSNHRFSHSTIGHSGSHPEISRNNIQQQSYLSSSNLPAGIQSGVFRPSAAIRKQKIPSTQVRIQ